MGHMANGHLSRKINSINAGVIWIQTHSSEICSALLYQLCYQNDPFKSVWTSKYAWYGKLPFLTNSNLTNSDSRYTHTQQHYNIQQQMNAQTHTYLCTNCLLSKCLTNHRSLYQGLPLNTTDKGHKHLRNHWCLHYLFYKVSEYKDWQAPDMLLYWYMVTEKRIINN